MAPALPWPATFRANDDCAAAERLQPRGRPARLACCRLCHDQVAWSSARHASTPSRSGPPRASPIRKNSDTPRAVAELLTRLGWGPSHLIVFSHLGGVREAVVEEQAHSWGDRRVADLNTIAIACRRTSTARALPLFAGLPNDAFEHDGQLTKREVRAATPRRSPCCPARLSGT